MAAKTDEAQSLKGMLGKPRKPVSVERCVPGEVPGQEGRWPEGQAKLTQAVALAVTDNYLPI